MPPGDAEILQGEHHLRAIKQYQPVRIPETFLDGYIRPALSFMLGGPDQDIVQ